MASARWQNCRTELANGKPTVLRTVLKDSVSQSTLKSRAGIRLDDFMDDSASREQLMEIGRLKRLAWADRRPSSIPLFVFGSLVIFAAPLEYSDLSNWRLFYWLIAGPVGFFLTAAWYRHRRVLTGVGAGRGSYLTAGVILLASFLIVIPLWIIALPTIGAALLVIAVRQRNAYLAACAVFFGVVGFLTEIFTFDNLLYRLANSLGLYRKTDGYFTGASTVVYAMWGFLMVIAGLIAYRREVRAVNE